MRMLLQKLACATGFHKLFREPWTKGSEIYQCGRDKCVFWTFDK